MTEKTKFEFTNKELVALMLKAQNIHEGNWALSANLAFSAMNIGQLPNGSDASPAGVVAVVGLAIERVSEQLPFSVNAAEANPKPQPKKSSPKK